mmetsp:Transcript_32218/g.75670  ORF Transcript_32218/g.75670 Transcript_32218/m.75670 type:complete len:123 (-) Transcript_32218:178-546(-)
MLHLRDIITDEDIEQWVTAAVRAAAPMMMTETRDVLVFAMREHQKVLTGQTLAMMKTLEAQSAAMQHTIELQGRQVSRLIAFGGFTGLCSKLWSELPPSKTWQRAALAVMYVVGLGGIIKCI